MVIGIGVDIVSVERLKKAFERQGERLYRRVFTEQEMFTAGDKAQHWQRLAARFAAKEAVMKCLGTGMWQVAFTDICILNEPGGRPVVSLGGRAADRAARMGVTRVLVSMSHERDYAVAYAMALAGEVQDGAFDS